MRACGRILPGPHSHGAAARGYSCHGGGVLPRGRAVRRDRSALVRPRPHGGRAARPRHPHVHDRHAAGRGDRPRRRRARRPLLRAAAQGRRLLRELRADGGAVRRRRPRGQADVQARRLVQPVPGVHLVAADGGPRRPVRGQGAAAARAARGGRGHSVADARPLRPRRRDRAAAGARGAHRRRDPHARRALGRPRPARGPRPRGDPAARPDPLPGPDRRDLQRRARRACRMPRRAAPQRPLVRPRPGRRAGALPRRLDVLGLAVRAEDRAAGPARPAAGRRRRLSRPDRRRVRRRRGRQVAVDLPPLRSHVRDRDEHREPARLRRRHPRRHAARRAAARHRQARDLQPDPRQARQAHRRRVRPRPPAPAVHAVDPRARAGLPRPRAAGRRPPRAPGRRRLPARPARGAADGPDARAGRRRRLRGADLRAPVPGGDELRAGARGDARRGAGPARRRGVRRPRDRAGGPSGRGLGARRARAHAVLDRRAF